MQKIGLVIPCFNESLRFNQDHFSQFVTGNPSIYFCLVNDGSSDNTKDMLSALAASHKDQVTFMDLPLNMGKADAVRQGILHGFRNRPCHYVGFIDADFSAPLDEVNHMVDYCHGNLSHAMIAGSRIQRMGASILRSGRRHYMGRMFATAAGIILNLRMYDSQCGLKLFRADMIDVFFGERFITQWLFDIELVLRLRNRVSKDRFNEEILEVPLTVWHEKGASKLKFKFFLSVPIDLFRIRFHYKQEESSK